MDNNILITKNEIEKMIPHGTSMCLLDGVIEWNEQTITTECHTHFSPTNPLLEKGDLAIVNLIEYGAQTAAIHAALNQTGLSVKRPAYLGAIKNIEFHCPIISSSTQSIEIKANCINSNPNGAIYLISAEGDGKPLLSGKIILVTPRV